MRQLNLSKLSEYSPNVPDYPEDVQPHARIDKVCGAARKEGTAPVDPKLGSERTSPFTVSTARPPRHVDANAFSKNMANRAPAASRMCWAQSMFASPKRRHDAKHSLSTAKSYVFCDPCE